MKNFLTLDENERKFIANHIESLSFVNSTAIHAKEATQHTDRMIELGKLSTDLFKLELQVNWFREFEKTGFSTLITEVPFLHETGVDLPKFIMQRRKELPPEVTPTLTCSKLSESFNMIPVCYEATSFLLNLLNKHPFIRIVELNDDEEQNFNMFMTLNPAAMISEIAEWERTYEEKFRDEQHKLKNRISAAEVDLANLKEAYRVVVETRKAEDEARRAQAEKEQMQKTVTEADQVFGESKWAKTRKWLSERF